MRCLLKLELETTASNRVIADGGLPKLLEQILEKTKPEATYFGTEAGQRTPFIFFDLSDPSDIPAIAEPAFANLGAKVTFIPVMNQDDLRRGLAQLS